MRVRDLSPAMIGQRIHVQADGLNITGVLQDLGVTTGQVVCGPYLDGVHITLSDHELKLTGDETCSIVGTPPGGQA